MRSCTVNYIDLNTVKERHSSGSGLGCSPALGSRTRLASVPFDSFCAAHHMLIQ